MKLFIIVRIISIISYPQNLLRNTDLSTKEQGLGEAGFSQILYWIEDSYFSLFDSKTMTWADWNDLD